MALNMSGRNLNKNEKFLIGVLTIVAVGFIGYTFIIEPSNKKLKPLKEKIIVLEEQVKAIENVELDISKKEKELEGLKVEYDKASETIPKTDRYPQVVRDIEGMASQSGVYIKDGVFGKPMVLGDNQGVQDVTQSNPATGLTAFTINLKVKGNYVQVLEFVKTLESDTRILEVTNIYSSADEADIGIVYYVAGGVDVESYDFNTNSYGKGNLFE